MESSFPEATRNMRSPDSEDRPIPNSYWIKPWRFAAGEYPGPAYDGEPAETLKALLEAGINHFIDLTEPHEMVPYVGLAERRAASLGVTVGWERHPILDASIPHTPERMTGALDAIDDAVFAGKNIYVHCLGGIGRTGTVVGCCLVRHGIAGDEALRRVAHWWRGAMNARYLPSSPETLEQEAYVRRWRELSRETENRWHNGQAGPFRGRCRDWSKMRALLGCDGTEDTNACLATRPERRKRCEIGVFR